MTHANQVVARLAELASVDEPTRRAGFEELLHVVEPEVMRIAARLCRDFRADRNTWFDDFAQLTRMAALKIFEEAAGDDRKLTEIHSFRGLLLFRARSVVVQFVNSSSGFNGASGMSGWQRRRRELERTRSQLAQELQRDPSDEEVVEATNTRIAKTYKDPKRHGLVCSVEDLHKIEFISADEVGVERATPTAATSSAEMHATERERLVHAVIATCDEDKDKSLGIIAREWFVDATHPDYDGPPSAAAIARKLGMKAPTVRSKVVQIREIAQRIAMYQFGFRQEGA